MITLDQLKVFICIVDSGSFTAAARQLNRAQSAVSTAVANLEGQLDIQLFDRRGHRPALTEAGRTLLGDARSVASRVDSLLERANWLADNPEPRVSLAVDVMFPIASLLGHLADFEMAFPYVELEVHTAALGGVAELVLDGACDIGVGMSSGDIPVDLAAQRAIAVPSVAVASATHSLAKLEPGFERRWVDDAVQIVLTDRSALADDQQRGVFSSRNWRVADLHTKREMLIAGFGWGSMPAHMVQDDLDHARLVQLEPQGVPTRVELWLHAIVRRSDPLGPASRWLHERLTQESA